ncbi:protein of unknown function [Burkholderia multivorans]
MGRLAPNKISTGSGSPRRLRIGPDSGKSSRSAESPELRLVSAAVPPHSFVLGSKGNHAGDEHGPRGEHAQRF